MTLWQLLYIEFVLLPGWAISAIREYIADLFPSRPARRQMAGYLMTRAELRQKLLAGIDRMLNTPLIAWRLTEEQRTILQAQRTLYLQDDSVVDKLLALMNRS